MILQQSKVTNGKLRRTPTSFNKHNMLQAMGLQKFGHDLATEQQQQYQEYV